MKCGEALVLMSVVVFALSSKRKCKPSRGGQPMNTRMMIFAASFCNLYLAQSSLEIETTPPANPPVEHVTDERLVAYVANRMVLPSGLTVRTWRWTKRPAAGYGDYPRKASWPRR